MSEKKKIHLVMMRHGESVWNNKNLFTGWVDVPLSKKGIEEALKAGERISQIPFDVIFISSLVRSSLTAFLAMSKYALGKVPVMQHPGGGKIEEWSKIHDKKTEKDCIPVFSAWELNERMYGNLQGLNKDETRRKFGEAQVKIWRRSFDTAPPEGESLKMTAERAIPYFNRSIVPVLEKGRNVLISAHGNSLRSIVMHLDNLSEDEVLSLEIPTGEPICYEYDGGKWIKEDVDSVQNAYAKGLY